MQLTPLIAVHITTALLATATGPVALWARKGRVQRPRLHRAFGYAWVTLMVVTALTAAFIRDPSLPNLAGFTPIHLLVPVTLAGLFGAFRALARGDIKGHRRSMQRLYLAACVLAGVLALLPGRYLGDLLWGQLGAFASLAAQNTTGIPMLIQLPVQQAQMLAPILRNTPLWVWGLLAALTALGLSQTKARTSGPARIVLLPFAMTALSIWGTLSAFGHSPQFGSVQLAWIVATSIALAAVAPMAAPAGARYDASSGRFHLPGSWVPLLLILAVFATRYVVNVELAMHPALAQDDTFTRVTSAFYGLFSGIFIGRAVRVWRLSFLPAPAAEPANA